MDTSVPQIRRLIESIHAAPFQYVLSLTGGGAGAIGLLLKGGGGSRTLLEAHIPYGAAALNDFLGKRPDQFCSLEISLALADRAYDRAAWLAPGKPILGLGLTASLASDRPKRGNHRFHIAVRALDFRKTYSLTLVKDARDRQSEEAIVETALLNVLAEAVGAAYQLPLSLLASENVIVTSSPQEIMEALFFRGEIPLLQVDLDGRLCRPTTRPPVLISGSFNPVHSGHWGLAAATAKLTEEAVGFELSVQNVDKPPLTPPVVRERLHQFTWRAPVWLTRAPTFAEKAALLPGTIFVIGFDTARRLVSPAYYQDSARAMTLALESILAHGCRFLVAGRFDSRDGFLELKHVLIPEPFAALFQEIPESVFRLDLSSTQLRSGGSA